MVYKIYILLFLFMVIQELRAYEPIFDEVYDTYPKDDELNFGYDRHRICGIKKYGDLYYGGLYDAYSFMKAPYTELSAISKAAHIMNCFNYKGYSYIIYREHNTTSIMRARIIRNFKFENYKYYYDHILSKLYAYDDVSHVMSLVKLNLLEKYWVEHNRTNNNEKLYFDKTYKIDSNILDLFIINNTIYSIVQGNNSFNKIIKQNILNSENEVIDEKTIINNFDFIPFPHINGNSNLNSGFMKISFNEGFPTMEFTPPSSKIIERIDSLDLKWAIILYVLDFIFILITLAFLKFFYKKYRDYKYGNEMKQHEKDLELLRSYSNSNQYSFSSDSDSNPYRKNSMIA